MSLWNFQNPLVDSLKRNQYEAFLISWYAILKGELVLILIHLLSGHCFPDRKVHQDQTPIRFRFPVLYSFSTISSSCRIPHETLGFVHRGGDIGIFCRNAEQ